jgi:hypothetical protein
MKSGVLRFEMPESGTLAQRPDNRWCEQCKCFFHKDRFAQHRKTKHGIVPQSISAPTISAPIKPSIIKKVKKSMPSSFKNQTSIKKDAHDRFPEPLYERQPRFEGGLRWEQGGSPGLGRRR